MISLRNPARTRAENERLAKGLGARSLLHAAAFLVPAAHLWLLGAAPETGGGRLRGSAMVALGFVPLLLAAAGLASALDAGLLDAAWLMALAVAGGHVAIPGILLGSVVLGAGLSAFVVAWRRPPAEPAMGVRRDGSLALRTRGPNSYAGPGSLGGTDSALRR